MDRQKGLRAGAEMHLATKVERAQPVRILPQEEAAALRLEISDRINRLFYHKAERAVVGLTEAVQYLHDQSAGHANCQAPQDEAVKRVRCGVRAVGTAAKSKKPFLNLKISKIIMW
jgi:hypothetical protein